MWAIEALMEVQNVQTTNDVKQGDHRYPTQGYALHSYTFTGHLITDLPHI